MVAKDIFGFGRRIVDAHVAWYENSSIGCWCLFHYATRTLVIPGLRRSVANGGNPHFNTDVALRKMPEMKAELLSSMSSRVSVRAVLDGYFSPLYQVSPLLQSILVTNR